MMEFIILWLVTSILVTLIALPHLFGNIEKIVAYVSYSKVDKEDKPITMFIVKLLCIWFWPLTGVVIGGYLILIPLKYLFKVIKIMYKENFEPKKVVKQAKVVIEPEYPPKEIPTAIYKD